MCTAKRTHLRTKSYEIYLLLEHHETLMASKFVWLVIKLRHDQLSKAPHARSTNNRSHACAYAHVQQMHALKGGATYQSTQLMPYNRFDSISSLNLRVLSMCEAYEGLQRKQRNPARICGDSMAEHKT
jgi:hypothetical protein